MIDLEDPYTLLEIYKESDGSIKAKSKWFFPNGEFEFGPCIVIGYDDKLEQYRIQWPNGTVKNASRFNLKFDREDERVLNSRKSEAAKHRDIAEILLKY